MSPVHLRPQEPREGRALPKPGSFQARLDTLASSSFSTHEPSSSGGRGENETEEGVGGTGRRPRPVACVSPVTQSPWGGSSHRHPILQPNKLRPAGGLQGRWCVGVGGPAFPRGPLCCSDPGLPSPLSHHFPLQTPGLQRDSSGAFWNILGVLQSQKKKREMKRGLGTVSFHYSGGRDAEDNGSRPAQTKTQARRGGAPLPSQLQGGHRQGMVVQVGPGENSRAYLKMN